MKKYIQKVLYVSLTLFLFGSCTDKYEQDVFGDSSSTQRMEEAIKEYHQILKSSPNGWVMQYYPDGSQRNMGGFNYVLNFTDDEVTALLVETGNKETSKFTIVPNGGPTLSFDDYNQALHYFAKPSNDRYQGLLGDYEFLFLSHTENEIILKGKKYGNKARLIRLQESSDKYVDKLDEISHQLSSGIVKFVLNDQEQKINILAPKNIAFANQGKDGNDKPIAYVITDKGVRFYEPIKVGEASYQDFEFNPTDNVLVSADGKAKFYVPFPLTFDIQKKLWETDVRVATDVSDKFKQKWEELNALNQNVRNGKVHPIIEFRTFRSGGKDHQAIVFAAQTSLAPNPNNYYYAPRKVSYTGTLNKGEVDIQDVSGIGVWGHFSHFQFFVDFVTQNAPYQTELDNPTNPQKVKLTSIKDPEVWFYITKQ